jgi:putative membrane protein
LGILLTVAFWALVVLAIVWLVRSFSGRGTGTAPAGRHWSGGQPAGTSRYPEPGSWGPSGPPGPPGAPGTPGAPGSASAVRATGPEQILAERFARGEIDEGEYRARLAVLRSAAEGTPPGTATPGPPPA